MFCSSLYVLLIHLSFDKLFEGVIYSGWLDMILKGQGLNFVENLASFEKTIKPHNQRFALNQSHSHSNVNHVLPYWDQNNRQREVHSIQTHHHYQTVCHWQDTAVRECGSITVLIKNSKHWRVCICVHVQCLAVFLMTLEIVITMNDKQNPQMLTVTPYLSRLYLTSPPRKVFPSSPLAWNSLGFFGLFFHCPQK